MLYQYFYDLLAPIFGVTGAPYWINTIVQWISAIIVLILIVGVISIIPMAFYFFIKVFKAWK